MIFKTLKMLVKLSCISLINKSLKNELQISILSHFYFLVDKLHVSIIWAKFEIQDYWQIFAKSINDNLRIYNKIDIVKI